MKICHILTCFFPSTAYGGPIYSISQRITGLSRRGHEITVLTSNVLDPRTNTKIQNMQDKLPNGTKIMRFPSLIIANHFSGIFPSALYLWLKNNHKKFDLFHISYAREVLPLISVNVLEHNHANVFLQPHGMLNRQDGPRKWIDELVTKKQLTKANAVITLQENEKLVIEKLAPKSKRVIIPNGINISEKYPDWVGSLNHDPIVLFLARLHPRKRVCTFIEMAKHVHQRFNNVKFRIVGPDGGDESVAMELVKRLNLEDTIIFVGPKSREEALLEYSRASVYVLSSIDEPFATTISEALMVGVPTVVTTSIHNLNMLQKHNAASVSAIDAASIAHAVEELLSNPELCRLRSINGKKCIVEELDNEKVITTLEECYLKYMNNNV
jgi:glycosyltransferase involved in cell wall biosynthesis